jgi:hypothetical protein
MRQLLAEVRPSEELVITADASTVTIAGADGQLVAWQTDGKKRQEAQMEGGVIETQAGWKYDVLQLVRDVPDGATLKREFKVSKDGKTMEVKVTLQNGGKAEKKLVYVKQ